MSLEFMTIAMFVVLIATIVTGLPLAYCLGGVAVLFGLIDNGWNVAALFDMFANNTWGLMNNYVLVAIPLFILMAQLLDRSKVAEQLFDALYIVVILLAAAGRFDEARTFARQFVNTAPPAFYGDAIAQLRQFIG